MRRPARAIVMIAALVLGIGSLPLMGGFVHKANAASFDKNNLMSDAIFDATGTMSTAQIQAFLNRYPNSCLRNYSAPRPIDYSTYGANASAADIIHTSALLYGVNPQVLIVTLEKEQTLVTGGAGCADWRYWSAMGYDCPDGGSRYNYPDKGIYGTCVAAERHAGFSAQVNHGAWQLQFNRQRAVGNLNWRGNQNIPNYGFYTQGYRRQSAGAPLLYYNGVATIDGQSVTMTNGPTATLYTYTPHISANQTFVQLFTNWFGSPTGPPQTAPPTTRPKPPPGTAAQHAAYADEIYNLFLGRSATASEQQVWVNYFAAGGSPANMVRLVTSVPEHRTATVAADYLRMLRRGADPGGLASWAGLLNRSDRNDTVLAGLAGSAEYFQHCGSDNNWFVVCLYRDLLGRAPDQTGYATWTRQLASGAMSRHGVASRIVGSGEYANDFVDESYKLILGRRADSGGLAWWSQIYERHHSEDSVRSGLAYSDEGFRHLAGIS